MENVLLIGSKGGIGNAINIKLKKQSYYVDSYDSSKLDLSLETSVDAFIKKIKPRYNHIVFSSGINKIKSFEKINKSDLYKALNINIINFLVLLASLLKGNISKKNNSIVMISSLYGTFGRKKRLPYVISKHAMNGACKSLAIELGKKNIRVNTISPGFIDTNLTKKNLSKKEISEIENKIPLGSLGKPKDIANAVCFLISKNAAYISGTDFTIDGGFSCGAFMGV